MVVRFELTGRRVCLDDISLLLCDDCCCDGLQCVSDFASVAGYYKISRVARIVIKGK